MADFEEDVKKALNPPVTVVAPPQGDVPVIVQGQPPVIADFAGAAIQQASPPVTVAPTDPLDEQIADPDLAGAAPVGGPDAEARMFGRANDLLDRKGAGGKKENGVVVQEQTTSEDPFMTAEARAQHQRARGDEIEQRYIAESMKQGLEQKQQAAELEALKASQAQFTRLGQVRDQELQQARVVRDRMNTISNEITREAENPASEGLFAGQSAGGALTRAIGLALIAAGAGMRARGGDMSGAEQAIQTIRDVSMMEVRRQQRVLQMKQGAHDALGTIIERHMANLQDAELAAKATEADLMRIAMVKAKQYAVDSAPVIGAAETKLLLARLEQEAIVAGADLNRLYGDKLRRTIDLKYTMPRRVLQQQAGRSPLAQPDAMVPPVAPPAAPTDPIEAYFAGLGHPAQVLDPAVAEATGVAPPPAPAPVPVPAAQQAAGVPAAVAAPGRQAGVPATPRPSAAVGPEASAEWQRLWDEGKIDAALAAMPTADRDFIKSSRDARMKEPDHAGNRNSALAAAVQDWKDQYSPNAPRSAQQNERTLRSNGQEYQLTVTGGEAQKVREAVLAADRLVAKYQRILKITKDYGGSFDAVPPELKGEVKTLATQIAALSSQAFEMGVIQKWDAELWKDMSGERLGEWITDPRTDFGAAARTAAQEAMRDRKMRLDAYARPTNDRPVAPREKPKK